MDDSLITMWIIALGMLSYCTWAIYQEWKLIYRPKKKSPCIHADDLL